MPEGTNYFALCMTLAIAIFLGNGMLLVVGKLWTNYELKVAAEMLQETTEKMRVESARKMKAMQIQNQERSRIAKIESAKQKNVQRIQRETCDFWGAEYRKSRTSYNKAMMDSGCNR
jgi:predicted metalloprotease